jgi:outer membrane lipoprotein LolB
VNTVYRNPVIHILVILLLSGCAAVEQVPGPDKTALWLAHRNKLEQLQSWQIKGRISVHIDNEAWSASLHWRQEAAAFNLQIIAPFGKGTFEMTGDPHGVVMRTSDNRLLHSDSAEALMLEHFGWFVPLSGLQYWIKGQAAPGNRAMKVSLDDKGRLLGQVQDGWRMEYSRYLQSGGYDLPGRITLQNNELQLNVRLLVREWNSG